MRTQENSCENRFKIAPTPANGPHQVTAARRGTARKACVWEGARDGRRQLMTTPTTTLFLVFLDGIHSPRVGYKPKELLLVVEIPYRCASEPNLRLAAKAAPVEKHPSKQGESNANSHTGYHWGFVATPLSE